MANSFVPIRSDTSESDTSSDESHNRQGEQTTQVDVSQPEKQADQSAYTFEPGARVSQPQLTDSASEPVHSEDELQFILQTQDMLVDLFIFADRRGVPQLRHRIINILAEKRESGWPWVSASFERVDKAFSNLPANSAFCRFLVDEATWCWAGGSQNADNLDEFTDVFCAKVMRRWMTVGRPPTIDPGQKEMQAPWRRDICKAYHDHADATDVKACRASMKTWTKSVAKKKGMEPVVKPMLLS